VIAPVRSFVLDPVLPFVVELVKLKFEWSPELMLMLAFARRGDASGVEGTLPSLGALMID
jgi:hypothetical protein